ELTNTNDNHSSIDNPQRYVIRSNRFYNVGPFCTGSISLQVVIYSPRTRDDDIMICNYPKSGTHWIWEIVQMLYRQQAEFVNVTKDDWMIECITKEKFDGLTSPRILNSHLYHSMLPQDFLRRKCKIIYTIRNPKDVAVSFYHHHRNILMTTPLIISLGLIILQNNIKEIKRLAEFLCIKCEDQLIGEIGTKCQIENMKREKIQNNEDWRDNTAGMYREGKDHLTMPLKDLVDSEGKCMTVLDVDGFLLPDFKFPSQEDDFRSMADHFVARDDDVLLCNYPKSGTHWVWEIIQMLHTQKAELIEYSKMKCMIESMSKESFDSLPSPRILNTHLEFSMLPKDFLRRKCKIVYTLRNPKDVAVSYYHHHRGLLMYNYDGSWDGYLERFLEGNLDYMSWFDNVRNWHKDIKEHKDYPIHVIHYEDMHKNGIEEIRKLAKFLEKPYNEKLLKGIQDKCQFEMMQKGKCHANFFWKENTAGIYREGKVGGWKKVFTVAQNEKFDKLFQEKIADLNLDIKFTL
ncbi:Hypothetical predicted protein, partial [Mytilus galloprovincialis]